MSSSTSMLALTSWMLSGPSAAAVAGGLPLTIAISRGHNFAAIDQLPPARTRLHVTLHSNTL